MAEWVSDEDARELLNSIAEDDENPEENTENQIYKVKGDTSKVFRLPEKTIEKFKYGYRSPIIKAEDCIYNPPIQNGKTLYGIRKVKTNY